MKRAHTAKTVDMCCMILFGMQNKATTEYILLLLLYVLNLFMRQEVLDFKRDNIKIRQKELVLPIIWQDFINTLHHCMLPPHGQQAIFPLLFNRCTNQGLIMISSCTHIMYFAHILISPEYSFFLSFLLPTLHPTPIKGSLLASHHMYRQTDTYNLNLDLSHNKSHVVLVWVCWVPLSMKISNVTHFSANGIILFSLEWIVAMFGPLRPRCRKHFLILVTLIRMRDT